MSIRTLNCDEIEELLPEYALGVLDADETAAVARHLEACPQHVQLLESYETVCDGMCFSVPVIEPPAKLRQGLLKSIVMGKRIQRRIAVPPQMGWAAAAVAAALLVIIGAWGMSLQGQLNEQMQLRDDFVEFATQPGIRIVAFDTMPEGDAAKGVIFMTGAQALIWVLGLPELEGEQVYQCWWLDEDGHRINGGAFAAEGNIAVWIIAVPEGDIALSGIEITREVREEQDGPEGPGVLSTEF